MMDRSEQKKKWIKEHERLSKLFIEDRLTFERERKRRIERTINRSQSASGRIRLRELQRDWDTILRNAGSAHNRFVLIQMLFWSQVRDVWNPSIKQYEKRLKKYFPNTRRHNFRPSLRRIE